MCVCVGEGVEGASGRGILATEDERWMRCSVFNIVEVDYGYLYIPR